MSLGFQLLIHKAREIAYIWMNNFQMINDKVAKNKKFLLLIANI
jgi:hypothetical protein